VRRVFHLYTLERKSIGAVARVLNADEVPTRHRMGKWERSTIWGMLKNPAYMGQAAYRKTQSVPRTRVTKLARDHGFYPKHVNSSSRDRDKEEWIYISVPQIVSEKVFARAQRQLEENKKLSPRNNKKYEYLLTGLLRCKECGYALGGKTASHTKYKRRYYRCMGQDGYRWPNGRVCPGHPVRVEVLDDLVWEHTRELIEEPAMVLSE
jgi:site-specific DNA recombinase